VVTECDEGFGDLDGEYYDTGEDEETAGCECEPDQYDDLAGEAARNDTPETAHDLGEEHDDVGDDTKFVTGRLSTEDDIDYFFVRAVDDNWESPTERFHVDIRLTSNPGDEFVLRVWRNVTTGRSEGEQTCSDADAVIRSDDYYSWRTDFSSDDPDAGRGEEGCTAIPENDVSRPPDVPSCDDNTAYFLVAVSRAETEARVPVVTCNEYELRIRNGPDE
jgi:hypothetical protein